MSIFQDVTFTYEDKEYKVKSNKVMMLIAEVESVITITDLANEKGPPLSLLAQGYGRALRFAGASVTDEEVYFSLFQEDAISSAQNAVTGLISLMVPTNAKADKKAKPSKKKST